MLFTREENEILTRTGPETPMGDLFRRFWMPVMIADELPEPDGTQKRIRLLGEDLIVFRDSNGRIGLLDEFCAHRRASLYFARNEECGIRCAYHGWKFDVDGNCVDIPSEPDYDEWKTKVTIKAYPTAESGGVIWTYMGPPELKPPLPEYEWTLLPDSHFRAQRRLQECNWLQGVEGGIDPVHVPFLHRYEIAEDPLFGNTQGADFLEQVTQVTFDGLETEGGIATVAKREGDNGTYYWRFGQWIMPCFSQAPPFGVNPVLNTSAWVPVDDENCFRYNIASHPTRPLAESERTDLEAGRGNQVQVDIETLRPFVNKDNDYMMDREGQRNRKTYCGVYGFGMQDQAIQENQEVILDRTKENLVAADRNIIMTRKRLLDAARELAEDGKDPPGLGASAQRVRSATILAPKEQTVQEVVDQGILVTRIGEPLTSV